MSHLEEQLISRLPSDIQTMLKSKSSRDPNSRFTSKLAALLSYVSRFPSSEDEIGVSWVNEVTFRLKKRVLISILGIKINTLNVNLRDLKFVQQTSPAKDGWTYWHKEGFTRSSASSFTEDPRIPESAGKFEMPVKPSWPFNLGCLGADGISQFFLNADRTWRDLTGPGRVQVIGAGEFLNRVARYFKREGQQEKNALDVLTTILAPKKSEYLNFEDLARFLAMFGPDRTAMLKIASLLECSHKSGQWLSFDGEGIEVGPLAGWFDPAEPNCLVIRNHETIMKVWNTPLVEVNRRQGYVIDQNGEMYRSWEDYFEKHPLGGTFCDIPSYLD
jgi:hypothetical protein